MSTVLKMFKTGCLAKSGNEIMAWGWRGGIGEFPPNPEVKKNEFPTSGEAASGEFKFFFTEGWGENSPIPPSHPQANNIVLERKIKH